MPVIEVEHLTKEYRLGALQSLKQTVANFGARLGGKPIPEYPLFKALDDINFTIEQGEVIGVIGHNGAGKSTLLKILARISTPTQGQVKVTGRIAPLIEVGAGFVPDFTGRENVYLNGAILGLSKSEIARKFDEIVEFSEMHQFIDTPVKRYSSGMQVRLAFAVATSVESEILIVDEVLAVGDLAFQRKCFDRMEDLIKRQGRTVLIVSHNIRQIERLCSRAILLDHGRIVESGLPSAVCSRLIDISNESIKKNAKAVARNTAYQGDGSISNVKLTLSQNNNTSITEVESERALSVLVEFDLAEHRKDVTFSIGVHTVDLLYLTADNSVDTPVDLPPGRHKIELNIESFNFVPGVFSLRLWVGTSTGTTFFNGENLLTFNVFSKDFLVSRQSGLALFLQDSHWRIKQ